MSSTAQLMNAHERVTLHQCIRLEMRSTPGDKGIYPIYRCTETRAERVFGCLRACTGDQWLKLMFPDVELVHAPDQRAISDQRAA